MMKKNKKILILITLMLVAAGVLNAQEIMAKSDTAKVRVQAGYNEKQSQEQLQVQANNQSGTQSQNRKGNASGVKQVHSARPDWSKAKGARPASVERPSGSRIPKGVGKPGGAKRPGKR